MEVAVRALDRDAGFALAKAMLAITSAPSTAATSPAESLIVVP
jgi:hypothetical protein